MTKNDKSKKFKFKKNGYPNKKGEPYEKIKKNCDYFFPISILHLCL